MDQRALGRSGATVSRIILGCGNFGGVGSAPALFGRGTPKDVAFRIMDAAWEIGVTSFDTADAYGGGRSETWIGEWRATKGQDVRERLQITTKTFNPMAAGEDRGLSRSRIRRQVETSLVRLGVEHIPLYMTHDFDPAVPPEETLQALDELRRAGKIGAIGASNYTAEQLAEALEISELEGMARFEWVQNAYSLLEQGDHETVFPVCREHGLGYTPFSPLAGGWLAGRYRRDEPPPPGSRAEQRPEGYARYRTDGVFDALDALADRARLRGVSMAGLALAWLLHVPELTGIVVGPNTVERFGMVEEALGLTLSAGEVSEIGGLFP
jgi:aryl-alcohol dehydrogenase-like predicted oxidoreductase